MTTFNEWHWGSKSLVKQRVKQTISEKKSSNAPFPCIPLLFLFRGDIVLKGIDGSCNIFNFFLYEIPWQAVVWGLMLAFVVWPTCQTNKSSHILQSCIQAYFSSLKSRNLTLIYFFNDDSLLMFQHNFFNYQQFIQ